MGDGSSYIALNSGVAVNEDGAEQANMGVQSSGPQRAGAGDSRGLGPAWRGDERRQLSLAERFAKFISDLGSMTTWIRRRFYGPMGIKSC